MTEKGSWWTDEFETRKVNAQQRMRSEKLLPPVQRFFDRQLDLEELELMGVSPRRQARPTSPIHSGTPSPLTTGPATLDGDDCSSQDAGVIEVAGGC